jgi:hypothetical protein
MQLPATLLTRIRLGVGVTALFGCDVASQEASEASVAPAPVQSRDEAEPKRGGIAGRVVEAIARSESEPTGSEPTTATPAPTVAASEVARVPELAPEAKPVPKAEDPTAFVPFSAPAGSLTRLDPPVTAEPPALKRASKPKPKPPEPKPAWEDPCPACGRG